jgi:cytochrome c oxidase assembly protein subunit 15
MTAAVLREETSVAARAPLNAVRAWLWSVAGLVFAMVLVGGATRLTESGLSITEWKPVTGVIPPLNAADWAAEFAKYRQIPQYAQSFPDMTIDGFRTIYFWEWSHRLLARFIGVAFLAPLIWFWATGRLTASLKRQLLGATGILALEPIVGWWMVASGLAERTEVSQYRLALHLMLGAAMFAAMVAIATGLRERPAQRIGPGVARAAGALAALVFVQAGLGALVAGLRAGREYNTWPLMDGSLIPSGLMFDAPLWRNFFENAATVQFQHRLVAYCILGLALWHALAASRVGGAVGRRARAVFALALCQAAIGVMTLVLVVPIWAGLLHQAFAMLLLGMAVAHWRATDLARRAA